MGKSKKHRNDEKHADTAAAVKQSNELYIVFIYWLLAVAAYSYCWNVMFSLEYAATVAGLTVLLFFTAILGSGGAMDFSRFKGKNAVISMAFTLLIVTVCMPLVGERIKKSEVPVVDPDAPAKFAPLASSQKVESSVAGGMTNAFQKAMMGGLPKQSGQVKTPTNAVTQRAIESSKRFIWGVVTKNEAVVESESTMELAAKVSTMELPESWTVNTENIDYKDIVCERQSFENKKLIFVLTVGEGRTCSITLSEGLTWEVSDFDLADILINHPLEAGISAE